MFIVSRFCLTFFINEISSKRCHNYHFDYSSSEAEKKDENSPAAKTKDPGLWRDLASYWIFGLCNNFGYVVMLTAAHAIIELIENGEKEGGVRFSKFNL